MALQSQGDATRAASPPAHNRYAKLGCKEPTRLILGQPPRTLTNCLNTGSQKARKCRGMCSESV